MRQRPVTTPSSQALAGDDECGTAWAPPVRRHPVCLMNGYRADDAHLPCRPINGCE